MIYNRNILTFSIIVFSQVKERSPDGTVIGDIQAVDPDTQDSQTVFLTIIDDPLQVLRIVDNTLQACVRGDRAC